MTPFPQQKSYLHNSASCTDVDKLSSSLSGTAIASSRNNDNQPPIKIAHVVSLINCKSSVRVTGYLDALAILRHSIHVNSVHGNPALSKYGYQMYAILHETGCGPQIPELVPFLRDQLGYVPLVRNTPVNISAIQNNWYRLRVENENCCGSAEFIKLYAYTLTDHPIVVHWDLDVAVLQPMDDLYDAMLYDGPEGRAARARLHIQRPNHQKLPDRIDAFLTRDVTMANPWERIQAVQGGFVVARPSMEHFQQYLDFILQANYVPGRGEGSGWGGLGYGGFHGAMAYQGVVAYFYGVIYKGHHVELDVCRWNQVVADVIWRGPERMAEFDHQCRDFPAFGVAHVENTPANGQCYDCRVLPVEETKTVHFTACKKPWECIIPYPRVPAQPHKAHAYRLQELTNITTCGKLFRRYFTYRQELEQLITNACRVTPVEAKGQFSPDYFMGYCHRARGYIPMQELPPNCSLDHVYGLATSGT